MSNRRDDYPNLNRTNGSGVPAWKSGGTGSRSIHNSARRPSGYTERYTGEVDDDEELIFDANGGTGIKKNRSAIRDVEETAAPGVPAWKRQGAEATASRRRSESPGSSSEERSETHRRSEEIPARGQRRPEADASVRRISDDGAARRRAAAENAVRRGTSEEARDNRSRTASAERRERPAGKRPGTGKGSKKRSLKRRIRKMIRRTPIIRYAAVAFIAVVLVLGVGFGARALVHKVFGGANIIAKAMPSEAEWNKKLFIASADVKAAMYDYDTAIDMLKEYKNYDSDEEIMARISEYEATKATLVEYPVDQITHIFFHMLLYKPDVTFNGGLCDNTDGMNIYMTTVSEFQKIIQEMYDRGYVMVSLYDVAAPGPSGDFEAGHIMLPPGKKAFVLSEDDVCCYHSYENSGIADKFIIDDETGKVKTHYTDLDGSEEVGDFDVLPIIDTFVEKHPDFSYKGAKGILAFTGYNGILGYRTDTTYDDNSPDVVDRDRHQTAWLEAHPDFNYDQDVEECKKVAAAIREDGWLFASHSWGHMWQDRIGDSDFAEDAKKWMDRVYPLLGECDIWIYPNGQDVDNNMYQARFECLQNYGFKYFCPVNSLQYSTRIDSYGLNQGRRNLDGYRMYYDMIDPDDDKLSDLFDVNEVFDPERPTPVPEI